jgi:hypothetical protein
VAYILDELEVRDGVIEVLYLVCLLIRVDDRFNLAFLEDALTEEDINEPDSFAGFQLGFEFRDALVDLSLAGQIVLENNP